MFRWVGGGGSGGGAGASHVSADGPPSPAPEATPSAGRKSVPQGSGEAC